MGVIIILTIAFVFIMAILISVSNKTDRQELLDSILKGTKDFSASFTVKNYDSKYLFSIDDNRRKILYIVANDETKHLIDFENIISVEIFEDSNITFSKSSLRTIGGGVIGGIIGGGAGAIVGGLSGNNQGKKKVKDIKVKILIRNYSIPAIYIDCLNTKGIEWDTDSSIVIKAYEEARNISDKLSVIIDLIDREEKSKKSTITEEQPLSTSSIVDELEKLYSLKSKGIISEEEYMKLKDKVLQK